MFCLLFYNNGDREFIVHVYKCTNGDN